MDCLAIATVNKNTFKPVSEFHIYQDPNIYFSDSKYGFRDAEYKNVFASLDDQSAEVAWGGSSTYDFKTYTLTLKDAEIGVNDDRYAMYFESAYRDTLYIRLIGDNGGGFLAFFFYLNFFIFASIKMFPKQISL